MSRVPRKTGPKTPPEKFCPVCHMEKTAHDPKCPNAPKKGR